MAARVGLLTICNLCEKVYDKDRSVWVKMAEYHAYHNWLPDGYALASHALTSRYPTITVLIHSDRSFKAVTSCAG